VNARSALPDGALYSVLLAYIASGELRKTSEIAGYY